MCVAWNDINFIFYDCFYELFFKLFHSFFPFLFSVVQKQAVILLFVALTQCQETTEEESRSLNVNTEDRKDKRGISLNLGTGFDGYSYVNPLSRAYTRGYTAPINEFGKKNK